MFAAKLSHWRKYFASDWLVLITVWDPSLPLFPPQKHMRRCRLHPSPWDTRCSAGSAERNLPKCRVREQAMKEGGHFMQNLVCLLGTVWFYLCSQLTSATSKIKSFCWDTLHSVNGIALIGFGTLGGCAGQRCVSLPCDALEEEHVWAH